MEGGGGLRSGQGSVCLQGGVEGFLKGSERPEAGCLGEFKCILIWSQHKPQTQNPEL